MSAKTNVSANNNDEGIESSKPSDSSCKAKRGKICLNRLAKRRAKGIIEEVQFNKFGQPVGRVACEMQSYIGVLARQHVKVNYKTWRDVPVDVKDMIWESVTLAYKVDQKWKAKCLESANTKWRSWKCRLYTDYIVPNKDNPGKLHEPPPDSGIQVVDWGQFVISRLSDEFKMLSEEQKERRKKDIYPHRLSHRGYASLAESMEDELYGDDDIDRAIMWKKARVTKEGAIEDENLKTTIQKIDDYICQKKDGVFKSKGNADLLTSALETPEHSGRVRAAGAYLNPQAYFKCPRESKGKRRVDCDQVHELVDARKKIAEQDARICEQDAKIEVYDTRLHLQDKVIYELVDRIGKLEGAISAKDKLEEEKGSCTVKYRPIDDELNQAKKVDDDVVVVDEGAVLQGKTVALTLKSSTTIVAYGTVVKLGGLLHGGPMPKGCARVSVDQVIDENALLPFPTSDIGTSVGDALGTHVAWPIHLLSQKEKLSTKKKGVQKVAKENKYTIKSFASLPATLKVICRYAETLLKDGRAIDMSLSPDLFGSSLDLHLHIEDIAPFCNLDPISANCIVAYVWHLYKKMRNMKLKEKEMFVWVNPFDISYNPSGNRDDRARLLADRLAIASTDQQVLIPCNVGGHWILTIVEPHKEHYFLMDPIAHRNRDDAWKYVVNTAMNIFNAGIGKKAKKLHTWEIIKGPMQRDSKQCGFFVMRFLKEIIDGNLKRDQNVSLKSMFQKREFSKDDIDVVREEWATEVIEYL